MATHSYFYYPVTLHVGLAQGLVYAPRLTTLPYIQTLSDEVIILENDVGDHVQGMYVYYKGWRYAMPMKSICVCTIQGDSIDIYLDVDLPIPLSSSAVVYKNGELTQIEVLQSGNAVYAVHQTICCPTNEGTF